MNALTQALRQTLTSRRLIWLIYGITLALGLLAALPMYNTLKTEDQNSLGPLNMLGGFDYTVFSDFMHRSGRAISPLMSVGRWLGVLYVFLSIFFTGGILLHFNQLGIRFSAGTFWQACSHYLRRYLGLFGVTFLFICVGAGVWLIAGVLAGIVLSDTLTERGVFFVGLVFFLFFVLTATLILCIGDYAKVLMFREDVRNGFRAFGRAGRLVFRNLGRTYGLYWLLILIGTGFFALYFLADSLITMRNWPTILIMLVIQQVLIFARVGLKVWALGTAAHVYETLPRPTPQLRPVPFSANPSAGEPVSEAAIPAATETSEKLDEPDSSVPTRDHERN